MIRIVFGCILFILEAQFAIAQIDTSKITIARDTFGIPHIFAPTDREVAYGLAWAHCEDDFEHFQLLFTVARARLGEKEGKNGAMVDYYVQFIKARELAEQKYETDLSQEFKDILQAYVDGINRYAAIHPKEIKLHKIFPVTSLDVITSYNVLLSAMVGVPMALKAIIENKPDEYIFLTMGSSNAIAMNSNITADSASFLLINPHLPLEGFASWYEAHLLSEQGLNVYGALLPGMIFPAVGCNEHLGWSITFNWPDYVDIYKMEVNPQNRNQYKFDDKWLDFEVRKINLEVDAGIANVDVRREALWCEYGPAIRTSKGVYALRYSSMFNVNAAEQWYKIGKSQNYEEFYNVMKLQEIPLFNFMMADDHRNIFYLFNAKLPVRDSLFNWQKTLPGNTSKTLWTNFYPLSQLPQKLNPHGGYLYNFNNTPFHCTDSTENLNEKLFDVHSGYFWNRVNNREFRFNELMKNRATVSWEEFIKIKYDCQYPYKKGGIYKTFQPIYQLNETDYPDISDAIAKIKKWDFTGYVDSREAALVMYCFIELFKQKKASYLELETGLSYSQDTLVKAIRYAKKEMLRHFKSIDVPFGEVQRLMRQDKSYPLGGLPECLNFIASQITKDGFLQPRIGDSFIMFAKFSKNGNSYQTVVPFGESRRKGNPHLTDQMELFSRQKTKSITLDKEEVLKKASRLYHPQ